MDAVTGKDEQTLLTLLAQARARLDGFVHDLRAVDAELEALATEREQHRLLDDACAALERLGDIGGARLFWGEHTGPGTSEDHLRRVRSRVEGFQKRLAEIEERREAVLDALDQQQYTTDLLAEDVLEAQEERERHLQEWIIEREISEVAWRELIMPWARGGEEDRRYRRSLTAALLACLLVALIVPLIHPPLPDPSEQTADVPDRVVRLMMKSRPLPPAPVREEAPPPQLAEQKPAEETAPQASAKPKEGPGQGPDKGPDKGLLAFREKFSSFTETQNVARLGSRARISNSGEANAPAERAMITTQAPGSSGGINLASLSRGVGAGTGGGGGAKIAGVQVARATSTIGGGGSGHSSGTGRSSDGPPLGRTDEEIQIVFDRHKAALYRLYNRELRNDPTLKGQMVLRIRIEPDGRVSLCELQSSDMRAPQLASQVLDRVRTFDFGAKDSIPAVTILYPIDFLPAT